MDGMVRLWDERQCLGSATRPFAESREAGQQELLGVAPGHTETMLLLVLRDGTLRLWDTRTLSATLSLRASGFVPGHAKSHCHAEVCRSCYRKPLCC